MSQELTAQERFQQALVATWKSVLDTIDCGDSSAKRAGVAAPALEFLEAQIAQFGYDVNREHRAIVPTGSHLNLQNGVVGGALETGERFWTKDGGVQTKTAETPATE